MAPFATEPDWLEQTKWFVKVTAGQLGNRRGRGLFWKEEESSGWMRRMS